MKKKLLTIILATTMALSFTACGSGGDSSGDTPKSTSESSTKEPEKEPEQEVTYQSILDDYTQKIKEATPGLVEEYNAEAAEKAGDVNALAELSNAKIEKLAEISNDGIGAFKPD